MCYYISFLVHFSLQVIKDSLSLSLFFWFTLFSVYLSIYLQTLWQKSQSPRYADPHHWLLVRWVLGVLPLIVLRSAELLSRLLHHAFAVVLPCHPEHSFRLSPLLPPISWISCLLYGYTPSFCWRTSSFAPSVGIRRGKIFGVIWRCLYHALTFIWWFGWV